MEKILPEPVPLLDPLGIFLGIQSGRVRFQPRSQLLDQRGENLLGAVEQPPRLADKLGFLLPRRFLSPLESLARPLHHHVAQLIACCDGIQAARLLFKELLQGLLRLIELLFSLDKIALHSRRLHERHASLVQQQFFE